MEVAIVTYTIVSFLICCVGCLFCQCCMIGRTIDLQTSRLASCAPPLPTSEPLQDEPTVPQV